MAQGDLITPPTLRVAAAKPKMTIYYALLIIALCAMLTACLFMFLEIKRFGGFGAVKTVRQPLPMCKAEVATCYDHRADELGCVNPEFFELPRGKPSFRVVEQQPSDPA